MTHLPSERVVVEAPASFTGSAKRIWRALTWDRPPSWLRTALALLTVTLVWTLVLAWYLSWGLFLVPYRLARRSSRKRRVDELRHREALVWPSMTKDAAR